MINWILGLFLPKPQEISEPQKERNLLEIHVKMVDEEVFTSIDHVYFVTKYDDIRGQVWTSEFTSKLHLIMDTLIHKALDSNQIGLRGRLSSVKGGWLRSVEPKFVISDIIITKMGHTRESLIALFHEKFEHARRVHLAKTF